jgi:hypothetical protein
MQIAMPIYLPNQVRVKISPNLLVAVDRVAPIIFSMVILAMIILTIAEIVPHVGDMIKADAARAVLTGRLGCGVSLGHLPTPVASDLSNHFGQLCGSYTNPS